MTAVNRKRELSGVVISSANKNTIVVEVKRREKHKLLDKYITRTSKIHAHDPKDECENGYQVVIRECRPHSKMKSWELAEIVTNTSNR